MDRRTLVSFALGAPMFAAGASCTGLLGFDGLRLSGAEAGAALSTGAGACAHRVPPGRPLVDGGGGSLDLVFATTSADFGLGYDDAGQPRYQSVGFDLDSRCASSGDPPVCVKPPWARADDSDGLGGVDNATGALLDNFYGPLTKQAEAYAAMGHPMLLRVRGYSGEMNDDRVQVSLYVGLRVVGNGIPMNDGHDVWTLRPDMLEAGDGGAPDVERPKFHDDEAYVNGNVLVAHFPEAFGGPGKPLVPDFLDHMVQVVLSAKLVYRAGLWELHEGVWGGRQPIHDALISMGYNPSLAQVGSVICQVPNEYELTKMTVCSYVDVASGPDNSGSACDAVSIGGTFESVQAQLGPVGSVQQNPACAVDLTAATCGP